MTTRPLRMATGPESAAAIRRELLQGLAPTAARLETRRPLSPTDVHDARKRLKRARALLALLEPALSESDFVACDRAFLAAGKSLATHRDATVLARTCARLRRHASFSPAAVASLPDSLRVNRHDRLAPTEALVTQRRLQQGLQRLASARLVARGWPAIGRGLRAVYRRGRRRMPAAKERHPTSECLHAWRRHVKRYWHVLELFEVADPDRLRGVVADARRLAEVLGQEHDLSLLAAHLEGHRSRHTAAHVEVLRELEDRRSRLTRRARKLGARVYAERPREVAEHMRRTWEHWRRRRGTGRGTTD